MRLEKNDLLVIIKQLKENIGKPQVIDGIPHVVLNYNSAVKMLKALEEVEKNY